LRKLTFKGRKKKPTEGKNGEGKGKTYKKERKNR